MSERLKNNGRKRDGRASFNEKKIVIMTKLAIYDKQFGGADRKDNDYFRHDYIYRKNMWNRFCAIIGAIILIFLYWLHQIVVKNVNILTIDFKQAGTDAAFFVLAVMMLYTLIGTVIAAGQYAKSQERLKAYVRLLNILDHARQSDLEDTEEDFDLHYEADTRSARDNHSLI
ncbi:MAG: hypothetical protein LBT44_06230 [Clostridiales bacterium]|nr:hypothetical protein [Clostridiales bacterium]